MLPQCNNHAPGVGAPAASAQIVLLHTLKLMTLSKLSPDTPWPYPRWIAHRGAGQLAPENTLAAFRLGAAHGYRMFECDAKLSADGVVFLLHDATLERTTNGQGTGGDLPWHTPVSYTHLTLPTNREV